MNKEKTVVKSIRMTEKDHQLIKQKAEENNMTIGTYLVKVASENGCGVKPEILCKLMEIANALEDPDILNDQEMKEIIGKDIRRVCILISRS